MIFASKVIEEARTFLGTPWFHTARVKGHGIDCLGLAILSYNSAGAHIEDRTNYTIHDEFVRLIRQIKKEEMYRVKDLNDLKTADIILFRETSRMLNHVGLFTGEKDGFGRYTFIHTYSGAACPKTIEEAYTPFWKSFTVGIYRHKEIVY